MGDGKKHRLEDLLNEFMIKLIERAYADKARRVQREQEERLREEAEARRKEREIRRQQRDAMLERFDTLAAACERALSGARS